VNVKLFILTSLFVLLSGSANAQNQPIGIIDFYGLRSVSEQQARDALQIKEGDPVPDSREEAQRRLEALPNVEQALLGYVCCEAGKALLYVGIKEKGATSLKFHSAPNGSTRLPETIVRAGDAFFDALTRGIEKGDAGEDESQGHALSSYPEARAIQERFITFAAQNFKLLRAVLHQSADAHHRALAAQVIAYTVNKRNVVNDLFYGMGDPDSDVRNSSMRSLAVIAVFAQLHPKRQIRVPVRPFIKMLSSIVWTDRNKSAFALDQLTQKRDPVILAQLRRQALQSLIEMARWKSSGHAYRPLVLLGRLGNLSEVEIQKYWDSGNREGLIDTIMKRIRSK
jgi:hypothetical protein